MNWFLLWFQESMVNGAVSGDWILTLAFSVIGVLITVLAGISARWVVTNMMTMQQELKTHSTDIGELKLREALREQREVSEVSFQKNNHELLEEIATKLNLALDR